MNDTSRVSNIQKNPDAGMDNSSLITRTVRTAGGFTLLEVLIVIVIIGLLASIVTVVTNAVRASARDARRKSDTQIIQGATELYFQKFSIYPAATATVADSGGPIGNGWISDEAQFVRPLKETGLLIALPHDPMNIDQRTQGKGDFRYTWLRNFSITNPSARKVFCADPNATVPTYTIEYTLETPNDPDTHLIQLSKVNTRACNDNGTSTETNNPNGFTRYVIIGN